MNAKLRMFTFLLVFHIIGCSSNPYRVIDPKEADKFVSPGDTVSAFMYDRTFVRLNVTELTDEYLMGEVFQFNGEKVDPIRGELPLWKVKKISIGSDVTPSLTTQIVNKIKYKKRGPLSKTWFRLITGGCFCP